MRTWVRPTFAAAILTALALTTPARAGVPQQFLEQGRLFDGAGVPLSGPVTLQFALYTQESGGAPVWTESQVVVLDSGYFSTVIGATLLTLIALAHQSIRAHRQETPAADPRGV